MDNLEDKEYRRIETSQKRKCTLKLEENYHLKGWKKRMNESKKIRLIEHLSQDCEQCTNWNFKSILIKTINKRS
jgi:hypothetical protein